MKRPSFLRALAVAACVLSAAPALAAPASPAAGITEARAASGTDGSTRRCRAPPARRDPRQRALPPRPRAVGAAEAPGIEDDRRDALLEEAIAAFRAMLVSRPELLRVRLELARAFFLKGEDGLAKGHFERVLAGNPPAGVALNVNHFLAQIRARKRWSVRVGAALAPDSNVTARSGERTILLDTQFGRLPFTYQGDKPRSGIGIALWAGGEYQYPVNPRWRLRAGGDISRREYRGAEFDRMTFPPISARDG